MEGKKPPLSLLLSEYPRYLAERAILLGLSNTVIPLPQGDGHGVLILPGFLSTDKHNASLICFLEKLGYNAGGWNLGVNHGATAHVLEYLEERLDSLAGKSTVSIIGHSLGGIYARELARELPHKVRQVITLGSPINQTPDEDTPTARLFRKINQEAPSPDLVMQLSKPLPVPTTCIYTHEDGVVHWENSMQRDGHARTENIRVRGSHIGLSSNLLVYQIIADRLLNTENSWRPFKTPLHLRGMVN